MKLAAAAAALALCAGAAPAQTIATADPDAMAQALAGMGYKPGAVDPNDGTPAFHVDIGDFDTVFVFGGCTEGKSCKYLLLVSRFTDVRNPPHEWLNARNESLDLGKLWLGEDGTVAFSMAVATGGEALPAPMVRFMIDQWTALIGALARSAVDEKLIH